MIHTFLFDMGNVLVHFSHERMYRQMGELCGWERDHVRRVLLDSRLQQEFEAGQHTEEEFHRQFEQMVNRTVDLEQLRLAVCDIFELNEPMVPLLEALKNHGHRLVLLSNTSISHFEFVHERFGVLQKFDDYVTSYEVQALKPDDAIYEAALKKIGCEPAECFYTDDIAEYVNHGRHFGFQAEVFIDVPTLIQQLNERGISLEPAC